MHNFDPWWTGSQWIVCADGFDTNDTWSIGIYTTPPTVAPEGIISSPEGNVTIEPGDAVTFEGAGEDPTTQRL